MDVKDYRKQVVRKRSTYCAPTERAVHRLKGRPGKRVWKVAFEPNGPDDAGGILELRGG